MDVFDIKKDRRDLYAPRAGVVAFVVASASSTTDVSLEAARDWVSATHPRSWAPRSLVVLDRLPLLDNGKVDRMTLRGLA